LFVAACGSDSDLSGPDPSVEAGVTPYTFTWKPEDPSAPAGERTFLLFAPDEYLENPEEELPLLVFLHGCCDLADDPEAVSAQPLLGVIEVLPHSIAVLAPVASQDDYNGFTWRPDYLNDLIVHAQSLLDIDVEGGWPSGGVPDGLCEIAEIPMRIYHGSADFVVAPQDSKRIADALAECGDQAEHIELPDVRHEADQVVFSDVSFYDWLLEQSRTS
jgi:predicted peptidase